MNKNDGTKPKKNFFILLKIKSSLNFNSDKKGFSYLSLRPPELSCLVNLAGLLACPFIASNRTSIPLSSNPVDASKSESCSSK